MRSKSSVGKTEGVNLIHEKNCFEFFENCFKNIPYSAIFKQDTVQKSVLCLSTRREVKFGKIAVQVFTKYLIKI